jgi:hypothetical protein
MRFMNGPFKLIENRDAATTRTDPWTRLRVAQLRMHAARACVIETYSRRAALARGLDMADATDQEKYALPSPE